MDLELIKRARSGDIRVRNRIVEENLSLCHKVAVYYVKRTSISIHDDLIQQGVFGILRAIDEWDPELSSFNTYAVLRIRSEMSRYVTHVLRSVQISPKPTSRTLRTLIETLPVGDPGREKLRLKLATYTAPVSVDWRSDEESELWIDSVVWTDPTQVDSNIQTQHWDMVQEAIQILPPRLRRIIELRLQNLTLTDIGNLDGLSRERIRQLEARAIRKLQEYLGVIDDPSTGEAKGE